MMRRAISSGLGALLLTLGSAVTQVDELRYRDLPHTDTAFQPAESRSLEAWQQRREWLRSQVLFAAGLWPPPRRVPLNSRIFGRVEGPGYSVEKVVFQSATGLTVTGNLYRPLLAEGPLPAVACPHGHWQEGRLHHDDRGSVPARCIVLARMGVVVFAWDMLGYNDSGHLEHRDPRLSSRENALWGIGPLQLQTWNSIRALDFLQSLEDVDGERIGVTGASGGGTQTFILSAVDPRVKVAAPVNMVSSIMQGGCICENAPALRVETNNMEIAAVFAPKPLLMISASGDWTRNTPQIEYPFLRSIYGLYGAGDRVTNAHFDAPHNYNLDSREAMYRFFARWLLESPDMRDIREGEMDIPSREDLLVYSEDDPTPSVDVDALSESLRADARLRLEEYRPESAEQLRELEEMFRTGISHAIGSRFPERSEVEVLVGSGAFGVYRRDGRSVRWTSIRGDAPNRGHVIVVAHPDGTAARSEAVALLSRVPGSSVVLIEPFGTGVARVPEGIDPARGSTPFFTTFNRTDAAETIYDILTAVAAVFGEPGVRRVDLVGLGSLGPACLIARALVPDEVGADLRTAIDLVGLDSRRAATYMELLELPNILRIGGLRAAAAVASNGPLFLSGAAFDPGWVESAASLRGVAVVVRRESAELPAIARWLERSSVRRGRSPSPHPADVRTRR